MSRRTAPPTEADFALLRDGMRAILATGLERGEAAWALSLGGPRVPENPGALIRAELCVGVPPFGFEKRSLAALPRGEAARAAGAEALEKAAFAAAARGAKVPLRRAYADVVRLTGAALPTQVGPYPDDIVALLFLSGRRTAEETIETGLAPPPPPTPREIIQRLFVRTLMEAEPGYAAERAAALEAACAIETSCYNAAVRASKESEEPPRRQWDSPAFIDIYSSRCGAICRLLDPGSSACRAYQATLVPRLLSGELAPGALGDLTEKELCPQASAAERAEIAKRSQQKVVEKESNFFRCPHCGERRSTYQETQRRCLDEAPDYLCRCLNPKCRRRFTGRS